MSLFLGGKKYKGVTLTGDRALETYAENTPPPEDVQNGRIYFANGNRFVGLGKAFEFALYGSKVVKKISDSNGNQYYGVTFDDVSENANIIFVAPSSTGDIVLQTNYLATISNGEKTKLGKNHTTGGEIMACYDKNRVIVYLTEFSQNPTIIRFFIGKDNAI